MKPESGLLTDQVAIVTGAAEGIGNGIALTFAEFGADIVAVDRKETELNTLVAQVEAIGRKAVAILGDVRDQTIVERSIAAATGNLGRLDILVNNVGGTFMKLFLDMTEQDWARMIELNFVQCLRYIKACADTWIANEIQGKIVNVTTIEAFRGAPGFSVYAAAKAGMTSMTETLGLELGPHGIRVNAIAPEATVTPGTGKVSGDSVRTGGAAHIPLGRRGTPDDNAGAALFLASDLSGWITGETIQVGGGAYAAKGFRLLPSGHWTLDGSSPLVQSGAAPSV